MIYTRAVTGSGKMKNFENETFRFLCQNILAKFTLN